MKKLLSAQQGNGIHWVGDGFPVRTVFSYNQNASRYSPFLLMDHAAPVEFPPSEHIRGVGEHPHRGFETVTVVYAGEVEHRDSHGGGGFIGPGDVQWMTAGSGLVHEEMHGRAFSKRGGAFEMVQLWVNLPAKDKMTKPRYQSIVNQQIPRKELADGAGHIRVIAGQLGDTTGPAMTFTPINLWDVSLKATKSVQLPIPPGHSTSLFVLRGEVELPDGDVLKGGMIGSFDREEEFLAVTAKTDATLLLLSGQPIEEPVVGHGPFVMNTAQEIQQAFDDYRAGLMGRINQ